MSLELVLIIIAIVLALVAEAEKNWRSWIIWSWIAFLVTLLPLKL